MFSACLSILHQFQFNSRNSVAMNHVEIAREEKEIYEIHNLIEFCTIYNSYVQNVGNRQTYFLQIDTEYYLNIEEKS